MVPRTAHCRVTATVNLILLGQTVELLLLQLTAVLEVIEFP